MKLRFMGLVLAICCLTSCASRPAEAEMEKRTMYFFGTFDTMITIIGYTADQATFDEVSAQAQKRFEELHQLFDAYNEYEGVQNIYTLNRDAHAAPIKVAPELMRLLVFARDWQGKLHGSVNIAFGRVLQIWHDYRARGMEDPEHASLPPMEALKAADLHTDLSAVILDEEAGTVFFSDPEVQLDVGSVAKGYATEIVAKMMLASAMPHFILNAGGNVRTGGAPLDGRQSWGVSIQNPDAALGLSAGDETAEVLYLSNLSVVTSGDYERFYAVNGVRYHHIISPETLLPATENRGVTIVCEDSGLADILSTAVFILPYAQSRPLVESLGAEALWIRPSGEILMTDGLRKMSKSGGATAN